MTGRQASPARGKAWREGTPTVARPPPIVTLPPRGQIALSRQNARFPPNVESYPPGVLPHHHTGDSPDIHGLEVAGVHAVPSPAQSCPFPPGEIAFRPTRTLLCSGRHPTESPCPSSVHGDIPPTGRGNCIGIATGSGTSLRT